jgi:hypothetical protein
MEQHAIPRQITSFEFKLIGFMTLRQFLYLVVAFPIAYIVYALFPIPILNILLAFIVAMIGVIIAFLPYQDRSLDIWAKNLWKRLQNPTQYYYHKRNDPLYFLKDLYFLADPHHMLAHIESKEKLAQYLAMTKQRPRANYQKKQIGALLQAPTNALQTSTAPIVPQDTAHAPSAAMQAAMKVSAAPAAPSMPQSPAPAVPKPVMPPAPVVPAIQSGPQTPLHPIAQTTPTPAAPLPAAKPVMMQTEVIQPKTPAPAPVVQAPVVIPPPPPAPVVSAPSAPVVATVTPPSSIPMPSAPQTPAPVIQPQVQLPQAPLVQQAPAAPIQAKVIPPQGQAGNQPFFSGVVRTSKRIPVPGILVYIKDDKGNPLRLMKSNPHGVFATFNPLPPGDYTFEIKDPTGTYFFDTMKVPVRESNSIPVEFMSKEIL